MSVKVQYDNDIIVVYSNLSEDIKVEKNQELEEGQCIGLAGNTTALLKAQSEQHVHVEAFKGEESYRSNAFNRLKNITDIRDN